MVCHEVVKAMLAKQHLHGSLQVGKLRSDLAPLWPAFDSSLLPDGVWWHTEQPGNPTAVCTQADDSFEQRMQQLRDFLSSRPEHSIALVAHWGVFATLTGQSLQNAQFLTITIVTLLLGRTAVLPRVQHRHCGYPRQACGVYAMLRNISIA